METTKNRNPIMPPLHTHRVMSRVIFNRVFALVYTTTIVALFYHHAIELLRSSSFFSIFINSSMLISDAILAFMWLTRLPFRMRPIIREEYIENLQKLVKKQDYPCLDIFICTADPYKEPPIKVVNTALSVMAYDYPTEKISIYVSDDGGSELTLFAFMEAAKFGKHWLPFCRENTIMDRCPDAYFRSNYPTTPQSQKIKIMYENMKFKVENVVQRGKVPEEFITNEEELEAFSKWNEKFTPHDHPTMIQILLEIGKNNDIRGCSMPNLIYVSREKSKTFAHHFKAGALNTLIRVSAMMTNAPIILTLDCDMYSNDPTTPQRALCYLMDHSIQESLGYVQFPQSFHGLNKADIYGSEAKWPFQINPRGVDGLAGPYHMGTGCFFRRRAFFSRPSSFVKPDIQELWPDHLVKKHVSDQSIVDMAYQVAGCSYESHTNWGWEIGFRYGSLVEDYFTGYKLQCEGWKSVFCYPRRPAFLGDIPISLFDVLDQNKRWGIGLLEIGFSKYSPLTYGIQAMGFLMGCSYSIFPFWAISSIPIAIYSFLPQLSLLCGITIFPKVSTPWFFLHVFLFLGAYGQDCLDFILAEGTLKRWWSEQRMWLIRGLSCHLFGLTEFLVKNLGITTHGFNVTSKVVDDEQRKRYDQGLFEFGVSSPIFVPIVMAAIVNFTALLGGLLRISVYGNLDGLLVQMFIAGFGVLNSLPFYDAMVLRADKGKMPTRTTIISTILSLCLYITFSFLVKMCN